MKNIFEGFVDHGFWRRSFAFFIKELFQVIRDPSSILIAFILPLLLLFLFGYGVSLDANVIKIGVVMEDTSPEARSLAYSFSGTKYFDVTFDTDRTKLIDKMVRSQLRGVVIIPQDFTDRLRRQSSSTDPSRDADVKVQVIADGSETNTANFVQNYADGVLNNWIQQFKSEHYTIATPPIAVDAQTWFNPELKSRYILLPGSIAITMTLIGILLTALVVAREWERGTMEAILATPIRISEFLLGKLIPYFLLGIGSMVLCVVVSTLVFDVPFRGSYVILFFATCIFLVASLGVGLLISSAAKNQFVATQFSLMIGFLPAFVLSGFIYEISSMPLPIQLLTYILPARYFVTILQTLFLTGNVWSLILPNMLCLVIVASILMWLTSRKVKKRLD